MDLLLIATKINPIELKSTKPVSKQLTIKQLHYFLIKLKKIKKIIIPLFNIVSKSLSQNHPI